MKETASKIDGPGVAVLKKNMMLLRTLRMSCGRLQSTRHHFVGVVVSPHDSLSPWTVIVEESSVIRQDIII